MVGRSGGWRWAIVGALFAYSCFPVVWSLLAIHGTTPPLAGGGAGMGELASYTYLDMSDRLDPVLGELGGSLLVLSFPLAFVASGVMLRWELRRRDDQEIEDRVREAEAKLAAREPAIIAKATLMGRINALQEIAEEIRVQWIGADLATERKHYGRCASAP